MNKLILDYNTWRCGGSGGINSSNKLGDGDTSMCNNQEFMCCLGQFTPQLNPEITIEMEKTFGDPEDVSNYTKKLIPLLSISGGMKEDVDGGDPYETFNNTTLSSKAIDINDDCNTTPQEKIEALKALFLPAGYEIEVINQPNYDKLESRVE